MISSVLVNNITNITELKKNPAVVADTDITCVLSNGKPCFYTVSSEKMESLQPLVEFSDENESFLISTIFSEMTGHERSIFNDCGNISKEAFKRIVISLGVNFAYVSSDEELKEILGV